MTTIRIVQIVVFCMTYALAEETSQGDPFKMAEEEAAMSGNPGIAFGMVIGAGLCTSLGAALAFVVPLEVTSQFFYLLWYLRDERE